MVSCATVTESVTLIVLIFSLLCPKVTLTKKEKFHHGNYFFCCEAVAGELAVQLFYQLKSVFNYGNCCVHLANLKPAALVI